MSNSAGFHVSFCVCGFMNTEAFRKAFGDLFQPSAILQLLYLCHGLWPGLSWERGPFRQGSHLWRWLPLQDSTAKTHTEKPLLLRRCMGDAINPTSTPTHWKPQPGFPHWEPHCICYFRAGHVFKNGAWGTSVNSNGLLRPCKMCLAVPLKCEPSLNSLV